MSEPVPGNGKKRNLPLGVPPSQKRQKAVPAGARCLEARNEWRFFFELLRAYQQEHRSANPSRNEWYRGFPLGEWVRDQRYFFKSLCSLGFTWQDEEADEMIVPGDLFVMPPAMHHHEQQPAILPEQHQQFVPQQHHDINPQAFHVPDEEEIKEIIEKDQYNPRANDGPGSRGPRGSDAERWKVMFALLQEYRAAHNSEFPKQSELYRGRKIGRWCAKQRQQLKLGKLTEDRKARLDSIGFLWDLGQRIQVAEGVTVGQWDFMYFLAKEYKKENGHLNPRLKEKFRSHSIGIWVRNQRAHYKMRMEGKLSLNSPQMSQNRIDLLNSINFEWTRPRRSDEVATKYESQWNLMFKLLQRYKSQNLHVCPLSSEVFKDESGVEHPLGSWVAQQRKDLKGIEADKLKGVDKDLLPKRKALLDELGIIWDDKKAVDAARRQAALTKRADVMDDPLEAAILAQRGGDKWIEFYKALCKYKRENGHTSPSQKEHFSGMALGSWVSRQRRSFKLKTTDQVEVQSALVMSPEREALLNKLGFIWETSKPVDRSIFEKIDNDDNVGKVKAERGGEAWLANYVSLKEFYDKNGHSNVTRGGTENTLASWVHKQRFNYKLRQEKKIPEKSIMMSESRIALLCRLDFPFDQRANVTFDGPSVSSHTLPTDRQPGEKTSTQNHADVRAIEGV